MPQRRFSDEEEAEIRRQYEAGETLLVLTGPFRMLNANPSLGG